MKTIKIIGDDYLGKFDVVRASSRCLIIQDGKILLSFMKNRNAYMIPGGGKEADESQYQCCLREVEEETGYVVKISDCVLEIEEYYTNEKYISRYYIGKIRKKGTQQLTEVEEEEGLEPIWMNVETALEMFRTGSLNKDIDEMIQGMYLREYTALTNVLNK